MNIRARANHGATVPGLRLALAVASFLSAAASFAFAQSWTETGDAGSLVGTAQVTTGSGSLATIVGQLSDIGDVDLYCVHLVAAPPSNLPLASINCAQFSDPNLYLFDADGMGVNASMTCWNGMKQVIAPGSLAPGHYYLGVSHGSYLPSSIVGNIWTLDYYSGPIVPNGVGAGSPLSHWVGPVPFVPPYDYQLNLNGNWIGFCEQATADESLSWGALKATYGN